MLLNGPPSPPKKRRRRAPEKWRGGQRRPRRIVDVPPPLPEETPFDFGWGSVFVHLLWDRLGRVEPYLRDLRIHDYSDETESCVLILTRSWIVQGTNTDSLRIVLRRNEPSSGFSSNPDTANDWNADSRYDRLERIRLSPYEAFSHMYHTLPRGEGRLIGFPAFTHQAFCSVGDLVGDTERLSILHDDYNISEPVLRLVVMAIREYYRRAAGGVPPAR